MEAGLGKSLEGQNARGLKKVADRARHWCILLMGAENRLPYPAPLPGPNTPIGGQGTNKGPHNAPHNNCRLTEA
jgi:hypothetical protein